MRMHTQSAGRTDIGKVRRRNEDAILVRDDAGLWVVADGLGGHAAGDYASGLVVERLAALPRDDRAFDFIAAIEDALAGVNADLRDAARARGVDLIASTVALLVRDGDGALWCGWVGDSRVYRYAGGKLVQLTRDHVFGAEFGVLPRVAGSGVLTRAVGAESAFAVDWAEVGGRPGDTFVLCSDGLNKELSDDEIAAACRHHASAVAVLDDVFATALARAARDNVSAVIVRLAG